MIRFDEVLSETVRLVEAAPLVNDLVAVTVIRDLKGRVRLTLEFAENWQAPPDFGTQKQNLENDLANTLGPYWGERIWRVGSSRARRDVAFQAMEQAIRNERQRWFDAPGSSGQFYWYKLERQFSKSSWQQSSAEPPWVLEDNPDKPAIISFYSFKGGVGRTTTVAAVALLLARAGKRVLVLDLDLEAPGVGPLLLDDIPIPDRGIVDYLVEWQLTQTRPNLSLYVTVQNRQDLVNQGQPLRVMTAGQLDTHFLEKLARLDFENFVNQEINPLVQLLHHVDETYDLDFILLDLRSGLHDLGGLSLNALSHLDILFGLETEQSWAGLEIVLRVLGQFSHREVLLVHAMNPLLLFDQRGQTHENFRNKGFDLFRQNYYTVDEDIPDIADDNAPYGLPISYETGLININRLSSVVHTLTNPNGDYIKLTRLIGTFLQRDTI